MFGQCDLVILILANHLLDSCCGNGLGAAMYGGLIYLAFLAFARTSSSAFEKFYTSVVTRTTRK